MLVAFPLPMTGKTSSRLEPLMTWHMCSCLALSRLIGKNATVTHAPDFFTVTSATAAFTPSLHLCTA